MGVFLEPNPFLNELHKMYERSATVSLTMKRSSLKPRKSKQPPPPEDAYKCLIRASDGKKTISTTVPQANHLKFAGSMNVIMRAHMGALKKRERKKGDAEAPHKKQ